MVILLLLVLAVNCFDFEIPTRSVRCFGEDITVGTVFAYEAFSKSDQNTFLARLTYNYQELIHENSNAYYDSYDYSAVDNGIHTVCIENQGKSDIKINLSVRIGISSNYQKLSVSSDLKKETEEAIRVSKQYILQINRKFQYVKSRDNELTFTNDTIYIRGYLFPLITIIILILIAAIQTLYFKRFLQSKKLI